MKKKNLAFTLAEVLIVIGIIGVVAALTLPNLNHATGDKERVTKVKKIYAALTDAVDRAQVIYGNIDTWFDGPSAENHERFAKRVTEFMKVSKECGTESGCFPSSVSYLVSYAGNDSSFNSYYTITLSDGTSLAFNASVSSVTPTLYDIVVDIDGPNKGKNQYGNDVFRFRIRINDFDEGYVTPLDSTGPGPSPICWGYSATGWVINYDNVDYLKADESLKCNDSNIILDGTTNTSCH